MFLLFHTCIIKREAEEEEEKSLQYNINTSNRLLIYECDEYWMNVNFFSAQLSPETKQQHGKDFYENFLDTMFKRNQQ